MDVDEIFEEQEVQARERLRPSAVFSTWILLATLFAPWVTTGAYCVFGRYVPLGPAAVLVLHYIVALIYCFIIGGITFGCTLAGAFLVAPFIGVGLYFLNLFVTMVIGSRSPNEGAILLMHIIFAIIATACYKGFSIPRVRWAH